MGNIIFLIDTIQMKEMRPESLSYLLSKVIQLLRAGAKFQNKPAGSESLCSGLFPLALSNI